MIETAAGELPNRPSGRRRICAVRAFCRRKNLGAGRIHFARAFQSPEGGSGQGPPKPKKKGLPIGSPFFLVRLKGLEPTRITAREPKGDVTLVKISSWNFRVKILQLHLVSRMLTLEFLAPLNIDLIEFLSCIKRFKVAFIHNIYTTDFRTRRIYGAEISMQVTTNTIS